MDDLGQGVNDAKSEDVASADDLDVFSDEYNLDEIDVYIQANLEDEIVRDALEKGIDLRHYSKQVEAELIKVENASIGDYIRETKNIVTLHKQISSCDAILEVMEQMLQGFQTDLTSISSEIKTLQDQSVKMNIKLKNRQAVKGELSQFVDEMVVSEDMIKVIMDSNVTEREFLEQLYELNHKINFVKQQTFNNARSCLDVKDILDKLKFKSLEKIREFFLLKIQQFRKPMTNYQIPQNAMLKYRFFNEFLMSHERNVAKEIRDKYIDTMNKIYYSYFKAYSTRIMKLQYDEVADKDDLMGVEDTAKKGFFANKPSLKNKSTIFSLGSRGNVLTADLEGPPIVAHSTQKFPYESLFRSLQYTLLDNCCREHLFLQDFYMVSGVASLELFNLIFSKTLGLLVKQVDAYVSDCFDAIALFLCMNIVEKFKVIMQKRGTSVLDRYWESLYVIIEPRFLHLLQLNIQSIRECDPQKLGQYDMRPHYMTRRYAEFTAAIAGLNEGSSNERVSVLMSQLQSEMDNFLNRLASVFVNRKDHLVFLINNYDIIINVIMERITESTRECELFKELMMTRTHEYVEEILHPHFGGIMTFVKDCEAKEGVDTNLANERRVIQLVRGFNNDWKKAIELINQEIMRYFSNFKNGTQILQGSLTQLIQYYHRFHKVLSQKPFASYPIRSELINIHNVMVEVKKHKLNF